DSSHLQCDQIIRNLSSGPISVCHWSRTFAIGGGHAWLPRSPRGRFPNGYVMYREKNTIGFKPEQANVRVREDDIWITGPPEFPKLGFDSHGGWMAYFAPNDLLFVKRFATYPDRAYNEIAGLTASVYYPERRPLVELEPIGPAEDLKPNEQSSFTEHWFVVEHAFPKDPDDLDQESLRSRLPK
ncbi:MAG: esterase, partial [Planctomycetota bacterium]